MLDRPALQTAEAGAQRRMTAHHLAQSRFQGVDLQLALDPHRGREVVERVARRQLVEQPEPLLREGEREVARVHTVHQGRCRPLPWLLVPRCGVPLDDGGQPGDRALLEEDAQRQLHPQGLPHPGGHPGDQERVAAEVVEVVFVADLGDAEEVPPDPGERGFDPACGRHVGGAQVGRPRMERPLRLALRGPGATSRHGGLLRLGIDPVAPALEGVGRQWHPAAALPAVVRPPVRPDTGQPQGPETAHQPLLIRLGPDVQQHAVGRQGREPLWRRAGGRQTPQPVRGIGGLGRGDPPPRLTGDERQRRRLQLDGCERCGKGARNGLQRRGGQIRQQPAVEDGQPQGLREGEDPRQAGRHQLAHAVAEHPLRPDAPGHPQPGEGVLHHEERRLGGDRPAQQLRAAVDLLPEDRLAVVEGAESLRGEVAFAGEGEEDRPLAIHLRGGEDPLGVARR